MHKLVAIAAFAGALVAGPSSFAGDITEPLDQIVVTAARSPLSIDAVGSALTVLDRTDIERRQARYVTDLLRSVPGFSVSHSGVAGSQTQVRVRGAEANHVLVLIDGVRANDPATGDEFRWEYLTTANVERIEIVRGPQSALWGSDAVAAVVHIITRSAESGPGVGGYLEAGTENTLNGSLHGGLGGDRWSLAFNAERLSTDGGNISRMGTEDDDSEIDAASVVAGLQLSDAWAVEFGARFTDAYSQFDAVDFVGTGLPVDSDVATEAQQATLRLETSIGHEDSRVLQHLRLRQFESDNRNLTDGTPDNSTSSDRLTLAYQADLRLGANTLALAAEHEETKFEQRGPVLFGDPNQDQTMSVTSAVADFQGNASDKLTWLASARFDDNSDFDDALTGRLSLAWRIDHALRLRTSLGTGRKNPTFIERFGFFPGQFVGNPALKPERSTSFDIGLDIALRDALFLDLTVFEQDLEDEINGFVFDPATFLSTAENLSGRSTRRGIEVAARWSPLADVELAASYTYTDSSEQDGAGSNVRELRRPRHAGSIHAHWRFADSRGGITMAADYGGTRADVFFPPFPRPSEIVTLGSYWLVDLTARFEVAPRITVFGRVSNLLDTDYEQVYGYRTPGRTVLVGLQAGIGQ